MVLVHETGLSHRIIGLAIDIHQNLGPGLLESVYQECLCLELKEAEISFARQVPLPLVYRNMKTDCGYRLDLIVNREIVVELKSVERLLPLHEAQILTYLKLSGCRIGLIINFNTVLLKDGIRRLVV
jgi:GxxExxY protein